MSKLELKETKDGSYTLFNEELNETYHSIHGARQESAHVFIKNGLELKKNLGSLKVLEIGVGTGLNLLLTYLFAEQNGIRIAYTGLEPFPVDKGLLMSYIHKNAHNKNEEQVWNSIMQNSEGAQGNLKYRILNEKLQQAELLDLYDVIYFDAFAPNKQSEMWEVDIFDKLYSLIQEEGVLCTYCAQGQFKRNLTAAGFTIQSVPGPPGKREMTLGLKP